MYPLPAERLLQYDRDRDRLERRSTTDRHDPSPADRPEPDAGVTAAVAAGVFAARWWLVRRGTLLAAVGLGLGVGLLGVLGGPVARTAVAALAATADILSATDALGGGPARGEAEAVRRTLAEPAFIDRLRDAILAALKEFPALAPVDVTVSR